ncbi:hypothetical protein [Desulfuromonas sp.]|uniref:SH3 domain-containing protein n=1 Tax=Desulfuromonas sp. TaxID=892 RepID=UPI0025C09E05|nr:hypothetical protein [Desulfuromonas sp.]
MRTKVFCIVLCIVSACLFSGCAAPVSEQIDLDLKSSTRSENVVKVLGQRELSVLIDIENGKIAVQDVKGDVSTEELKELYEKNASTLARVGVDKADSTTLKECITISSLGKFSTCYGYNTPKGSLFSETTPNAGGIFANTVTSPLLAALLILEPVETYNMIRAGVTDKKINSDQVDRVGQHVNNLLLEELTLAVKDIDSIEKFVQKYPAAGLASSPFILKSLSGFADDDFDRLDKNSIAELKAFIEKYSEVFSSPCLTPTISKLNVRKGPGTKHGVAFTLGEKDTICNVLQTKGGWVQFSGAEKNRKYSGKYWVSRQYLKPAASGVVSSAGNQLSSLLAQAKKEEAAIAKNIQLRKQRQRAAEAEKRRIAQVKKEAELKRQKLAKIKPQLDAAIALRSMVNLEAFISAYRDDADAAELIKVANAKYKELLFSE